MTVLEVILSQISEKQAQLTDLITSNRITTIEEYKFLCGEVQALKCVREYVKDAKDKLEQYDDE